MGRTPTRVGVVGYGYWGSKHVRVLNSLPDVEVTVIDNDEQRLREAMASFPSVRIATDLADELESQDAVVVATPPGVHAKVALQALNAGLHTLVEKPLANSVEEAEALVEAAERNDVRLMVGHTFEYNAAVWKLKEIISSGQLGRVRFVDITWGSPGRYRNDRALIQGFVADLISIVSHLLGELPTQVSVWARLNVRAADNNIIDVKVEFERSGAAAYGRHFCLCPEENRGITVVGENRMAFHHSGPSAPDSVQLYEASPGFPVRYPIDDVISPDLPFHDPLLIQDSHFLECVRTGNEPRTPGRRGLDIVRALAATTVINATGPSTDVLPPGSN